MLTYLKKSPVDAYSLTHGEVAGRGAKARLTEGGTILLRLLTYPD